jgi:hypothetical protein
MGLTATATSRVAQDVIGISFVNLSIEILE